MKYCSYCGSEINDNTIVCVKCGCSVAEFKRKNIGLIIVIILCILFGSGLIFIITTSVITYKILSNRNDTETILDSTNENTGIKPLYSTFKLIGLLNTRTKDQTHTVIVDMLIEYDYNNNVAQAELTEKIYRLSVLSETNFIMIQPY